MSERRCLEFLHSDFCSAGRYAYEALISRVPALLTNSLGLGVTIPALSPMSPPLKEADFPKVSFWTREKWTAREKVDDISNSKKMGERGGRQMARGINISMRYVEDEGGVVIDGFRIKTILGAAHQLFFQLREVKRHPKTWGAAGTETLRAYCQEMEQQFPELALCADSWKSKWIATQNYPSWYNSHGKLMVKVEAPDDAIETNYPTKKHRSLKDDHKSLKKWKMESLQSKPELPSSLPPQASTQFFIWYYTCSDAITSLRCPFRRKYPQQI